jgi:hypothetical protein
MGGTCSTFRKARNAYTILLGKSKGERPLAGRKRRLEDNIKKDLRNIRYELDSTGPRLCSVMGSCECGNEQSGYIKGGEFIDQLSGYQLLKENFAPGN